MSLLIIFLFSTIAFALSAICGGGASMMLIPLLGRVVSVRQVPAALSIGTFTSSASRLWVFRKYIHWKIVVYFVPAALPAVWLGAWLLKFINPVYLEIAIGLFLISNLPAIIKTKTKDYEKTASHRQLIIIGFLAGFLSGITGAVGLLFNKFYLRHGLAKEEIVATRAANEICLHLIKIVLYTLFALLTHEVLYIGLVIAAAAIVSTWLTKSILTQLSETWFKKIGFAAMVLSGCLMLKQAVSDLLTTHQASIYAAGMDKGFETSLKWQREQFSLEFTYDEGFEFEQRIPFTALDSQQQELVKSRRTDADQIIIEIVYSIGKRSYEGYYFRDNHLLEKYSFE